MHGNDDYGLAAQSEATQARQTKCEPADAPQSQKRGCAFCHQTIKPNYPTENPKERICVDCLGWHLGRIPEGETG